MKKTVNINLSGQPFIIDEDAYEMLSEYLSTLRQAFSTSGEADITNDIESRMAEIFDERYAGGQGIITIEDTRSVIERIGRPEKILGEIEEINITADPSACAREGSATAAGDDAGSVSETVIETVTEQPAGSVTPPPPLIQKRLFRDPRNKLLGGVCSGLAWYLNVDVVWVRLITAGLCFLSLSVVGIAYLVLWIIVPEAVTPYQRLQMMGQSPSVGNIGKVVTDTFRSPFRTAASTPSPDGEPTKEGHRVANTLTEIFALLGKAVMAVIGVVCVPAVIAIVLAVLVLIFALLLISFPSMQWLYPAWSPENVYWAGHPMVTTSVWCAICWLVGIGVPLFLLGWLCFKGLSNRSGRLPRTLKIILISLWVAAFIGAACTTAMLGVHDYEPFEFLEYHDSDGPSAAVAVAPYDDAMEELDRRIDSIADHADSIAAQADRIADRADSIADDAMRRAEQAMRRAGGRHR